jgi:3',5'-cyclic AMP phosphodiesterase CpdA
MKQYLPSYFVLIFCLAFVCSKGQDLSFIALGDLHFDRMEYHDMDYVKTRPQDYEQIMKEYPQYTATILPKFLQLIKKQTIGLKPSVKAVVQLGDLVEGVSGNISLARQMNTGAINLLDSVQLPVPWVLVKGNHDVSNSPGQPQAWEEVIEPYTAKQVKKEVHHGMYTYNISNDVELFVLDQFFSVDRNLPETAIISFLEKELAASKAKHKFVLTHQPVIPVTQRCWHLLAGIRRPLSDTGKLRDTFLKLLAKYKVVVLSAHLHEYSVVSRQTGAGNVVQVMINSVNRGIEPPIPKNYTHDYKGEGWVDEKSDWQPATKDVRYKILSEEKKQVLQFTKADLPGYAVIRISGSTNEVLLDYYNGFSEKPFETVNLTALQNLPGKD